LTTVIAEIAVVLSGPTTIFVLLSVLIMKHLHECFPSFTYQALLDNPWNNFDAAISVSLINCFMKNRGKETHSGPLVRMALRAKACPVGGITRLL
jgi:hypothetical protein